MKNITLAIALALAALAAPAAAEPDREDRRDRAEQRDREDKRDRTRTPYSNRSQFERRQIRDAIREADRPRRGTYRFRRARERNPG